MENILDKYQLIASGFYEMKKSKFSCYIFQVKTYEEFCNLKKDFFQINNKCAHIVNVGVFSNKEIASEDGEVGASAKKILFTIKKLGLKDVAIFIKRIFGGTLLGVGNVEKSFMNSFKDALKEMNYDGRKW